MKVRFYATNAVGLASNDSVPRSTIRSTTRALYACPSAGTAAPDGAHTDSTMRRALPGGDDGAPLPQALLGCLVDDVDSPAFDAMSAPVQARSASGVVKIEAARRTAIASGMWIRTRPGLAAMGWDLVRDDLERGVRVGNLECTLLPAAVSASCIDRHPVTWNVLPPRQQSRWV